MNKFYHLLGILGAVILMQGCTDQFSLFEPVDHSDPLVLILNNSQDPTSLELSKHATKPFDYAHIPHNQKDMSLADSINIPESIKVIYLATDVVEEFSDENIIEIVRFVAAGNRLVVMAPLYDERFAHLIGIKEDAEYTSNSRAEGFNFFEHVFPDYRGKKFKTNEPFRHYGFDRSQFIADTTVIASAQNDPDYPAILKREIGQGDVIYYNTKVMDEKDYRGLSFTASLQALESIPYRIANVSTIFLDDFPAPLYPEKMAPIDEEYDMTHAEFVSEIWWPDMKKLADRFDINYTSMLAFNYNAVVVPPFDFGEWENVSIEVNGRKRNAGSLIALDVKNSRHELGFHGYNHFSLWNKDWQNRDFMEASLKAAKKRWNIDNLGPFPVTYVPPTNHIDEIGLQALKSAMPSIRHISSLYLGEVEEGGGREFGSDPVAPELVAYPRITSGFVNNDISNFNQQSLFLYTGIWTHFIHPDDVFQVTQRAEDNYKSRNPLGLGWRSSTAYDYGLYDVFRQRLEETVQRYPISRFLAVRESVPLVKNWMQTKSNYYMEDEEVKVLSNSGGEGNKQKYWLNYVSKKNQARMEYILAEAEITFHKSSIWDGALYQFSTTSDSLVLPHRRLQTDHAIAEQVVEQYRTMLATVDEHKDMGNEITSWRDTRLEDALSALDENPNKKDLQDKVISLAVEFDSLQLAIPILEERLLNSQSDTSATNELLKFYGWSEQIDRAYGFLDTLWNAHKNEQVLVIKEEVVSMYGIPDAEFEEKWLQRRYRLNPDDPLLLQELAYRADSWEQRKNYLLDLVSTEAYSDMLFSYVTEQYLSNSEPDHFLDLIRSSELDERAADKLSQYADDIAYFYAANNDLSRAGIWAAKTDSISIITQLDWLLQQKRYSEFIGQSRKYLEQNPRNDSLRNYVGQQLIYENFADRGYNILYPLFEWHAAPHQAKEFIQNKISYMEYPIQKEFYKQYPAFFSEDQEKSVMINYRQNEGLKTGLSTNLAADNYNQNTAETALFFEWGDRQQVSHHISLSERLIGTEIPALVNSTRIDLYHLNYVYRQRFDGYSRELIFGGGLYGNNDRLFPHLQARYWWSETEAFTSIKADIKPIFTVPAVNQKISRLKAEIYREDNWLNDYMETRFSMNSSWYSDNNFALEISSKFYADWSWSTPVRKIRPLVNISYANAKHDNEGGLPYYTPNRLLRYGTGLHLQYQDVQYDPGFMVDLELMAKADNRNENFVVAMGRIQKEIMDFWEISLAGYLSTSKVYRYNSVKFTLSYILPGSP